MPDNDPAALAALLPSLRARIQASKTVLEQHLAEYPGYVAWSGGRDSTAAVLLARSINSDVPVVWFDSGLEYPENRSYMMEQAARLKLNFTIIPAEPDALAMLASSGAWEHGESPTVRRYDFHDILITQPSGKAHELYGPGEITGLRAGESVGRRILLAQGKGVYHRRDGSAVCSPVWRWNTMDVTGYLSQQGMPENPIYEKLRNLGAPPHSQRVGLVVDGNGAEYGRFTWLKAGWPELWGELCDALPRLRELR